MITFTRFKIGLITISLLAAALIWAPVVDAAPKPSDTLGKSDLNRDGVVDLLDVELLSTNYLQQAVYQVDWCLFYENTIAGLDFDGKSTSYYLKHFKALLAFIYQEFDCEAGPFLLELENSPVYLLRMAQSDTGDIYISDPRLGSVFIYSASLQPQLEIKDLNIPLGLAIDSQGNILVGSDSGNHVEVYRASDGNLLEVFGADRVRMPNSITIGPGDEIYVTDSKSNTVWVFDANYQFVRSIGSRGVGERGLNFPVDCAVIGFDSSDGLVHEVFVADQGNKRVQVFDLAGNWLRSITFAGIEGQNCSWMTGVCEIPGKPPFTRLQALDIDSLGKLHVLDNFAASVHIFDSVDGTYLESYGEYGIESGFLRVPMDVLLTAPDTAIVTSGNGDTIELFTIQ